MGRMTIGGGFSALFGFVRSNWLLITGALVLLVLVAAGLGFALLGGWVASLETGAPPDPVVAMGMIGRIYLFALLFSVAFFAVSFLAWRHDLTGGTESPLRNIGRALGASALSMLAAIVVGIVLVIAFYLVLLILVLIFAAVFGMSGLSVENLGNLGAAGMSVGAGVFIVVLYVAMIIGFYWVYGRFLAAGPVMAAQRTVNPITGLSESWRLTGPSQWVIVGFQLLLLVVNLVAIFLFAVIGGGLSGLATSMAGSPDAMAMGSIVIMALAYLPSLFIAIATPMAVYRQVAPDAAENIGDVFV